MICILIMCKEALITHSLLLLLFIILIHRTRISIYRNISNIAAYTRWVSCYVVWIALRNVCNVHIWYVFFLFAVVFFCMLSWHSTSSLTELRRIHDFDIQFSVLFPTRTVRCVCEPLQFSRICNLILVALVSFIRISWQTDQICRNSIKSLVIYDLFEHLKSIEHIHT